MTAALVGALVACIVLAVTTWRARDDARRMRGRLEHSSAALEHLQQSFRRFAPGDVIEGLIHGAPTAPEKCEVTVLFADLVGFTALSERLEPAVLVSILNGYFDRVSRAIGEHHGHVSKFIGDGVLALFGALKPNPWQADDAVRAGLAIRAVVAEYNVALAADGMPTLAVGIGIDRGPVIAGLMGTRNLMEFTVIGRTVNRASRVQAATREHGVDLLVTEPVRAALDSQTALRALPPANLKGVAEPVPLWTIDPPA